MSTALENTSTVVAATIRRTNTRTFLARVASSVLPNIDPQSQIRFRGTALEAIHEAGELFLWDYFQNAYNNLEARQFRPMAVINIAPTAEFSNTTIEAVAAGKSNFIIIKTLRRRNVMLLLHVLSWVGAIFFGLDYSGPGQFGL